MDDDRRRWDERYADRGAQPPRPPDALTAAGIVDEVVDRLGDRPRLLDVAAGLGPVARWAVRHGMSVVALDVSPVAVTAIESCDEAFGIDARCVDLDDGLPSDIGHFDVVVCQRFRSRGVIETLPERVAPGGTLVVTVLSAVGADSPGPFHAEPGELGRLLDGPCTGWTTLHAAEGDGEASLVLQRPDGVPGEGPTSDATRGGAS